MIEIKNLLKCYGENIAVNNISFSVDKGEILGFLGPNGAGKSTTMNILTGYISYTEGSVMIDGIDMLKNPTDCKKRIGYLPEQPPLYMDMTVTEYLDFVCDIKKIKESKKEHIEDVLNMVGIIDVKDRLIKNLSKGYKQRVGIAQALIGNPEILILDEPTVGLDPKQIIEIRNLIKELGKNRTVILSSHILSEISAICERVIIINGGEIVAIDTPENLGKSLSSNNRYIVTSDDDASKVKEVIASIDGVVSVTASEGKEEGTTDFTIEATSDIRKDITFELANKGISILMIADDELSLEDIFLELTDDNAINYEGSYDTSYEIEPEVADEIEKLEKIAEKEEEKDEANI